MCMYVNLADMNKTLMIILILFCIAGVINCLFLAKIIIKVDDCSSARIYMIIRKTTGISLIGSYYFCMKALQPFDILSDFYLTLFIFNT